MLLAGLLLGLLLHPSSVFALCVCYYDDGRFTIDQPLFIDGDMGDWSAVLADPDNNVCDGATDNAGTIFQPQPDLDAPVQSTGRDLAHFAYTWDGSAVYTYTERAASTNNTQNFIYYADIDNDGLMETGEPVIVAMWQGNNRAVDLFVGNYVEAAPGGDPLVDASGFADGYKLPGSATNFPSPGRPDYTGRWGSSDGLKMEWSIPWSVLGLPAYSAFTFHVSSTNATPQAASFPDQVDDNMGGVRRRPGDHPVRRPHLRARRFPAGRARGHPVRPSRADQHRQRQRQLRPDVPGRRRVHPDGDRLLPRPGHRRHL